MLYRALSYLGFGGLMPAWMLHPKLRQGIDRRLGNYPSNPWPASKGAGPRIWLHGASAGDLIALSPVIAELRAMEPEATLILSTLTNSGFVIAEGKLRSLVEATTFLPYDLPGATRKAIDAIQPDLLVLEYTEIWPNLIDAAAKSGAALALTNGRLNEELMGRYRLFFRISGRPFERFDLLLMRTEAEAERALSLGAPRDRVFVTGNTKFDLVQTQADRSTVEELRASFGLGDEPLFVAGSTHEGEEARLIEVFRELRKSEPRLRFALAPRYAERGTKVANIAREAGFECALRTECSSKKPASSEVPVLVLDTIGELLALYELASLVVVGGSFVKRGGQNILEPAGQGRPVLYGPSMMNFRDSVEVLQGRGGIQVSDFQELTSVAQSLLQRPSELVELGEMARASVGKVFGASKRNAEMLLRAARDAQGRRHRRQKPSPR